MVGNRLVGEHLPDEGLDRRRVYQLRQRPRAPRPVFFVRRRDAERAEAIITCEVQVLEQRQARRLVEELDDTLTPSIRACVVDGPDGRVLRRREQLLGDEREILAEREATFEPGVRVAQRDTSRRAHRVERADHDGIDWVREQPEKQLIGDPIGQASGATHVLAACVRDVRPPTQATSRFVASRPLEPLARGHLDPSPDRQAQVAPVRGRASTTPWPRCPALRPDRRARGESTWGWRRRSAWPRRAAFPSAGRAQWLGSRRASSARGTPLAEAWRSPQEPLA